MEKKMKIRMETILGIQEYLVDKVTKTQIVTKPINNVGALLRFRKPDCLENGMRIRIIPKETWSSTKYFLKIKED